MWPRRSSVTRQDKKDFKKKTVKIPTVQRTQELISEDSGMSLRKLTTILRVSEATMRRVAEESLNIVSKVREKIVFFFFPIFPRIFFVFFYQGLEKFIGKIQKLLYCGGIKITYFTIRFLNSN